MATPKLRLILRRSIGVATLLMIALGLIASWQWFGSERYSISSVSLGEARSYRIFNGQATGPVIYSLDGQTVRNGLLPAILFSTAAVLQGRPLPKIVAIDSNDMRDRDFRPVASAPTFWRPKIAGRASKFDFFLLSELMPKVEGRANSDVPRYVMGHSLSGLYVLDLATREPDRFDGFFAFAPTFSHDVSISDRLPSSCRANSFLYSNWGLESARDTAVFDATVARWTASPECRRYPPLISRHHGSVHAMIMMTGQLHLALVMPE